MNKIIQIYKELKKRYGPQGWWPIVNNKTLICEYGICAPRNEAESLEISIGAILTQGTQWYPNVIRAIQQLKLGREFTKKELEVIRQAEIYKGHIREKPRKQTTNHILTQNTNWKNVEKALFNLNKNNLINVEKINKIKREKLAELIKPSGYYNQKAKKLKNFSYFLIKNYNGKLKRLFNKNIKGLRNELLSINGIGPETADSIILYAAEKPTFVIDAYTKRVYSRVFNKEEPKYKDLQKIFENSLKKDTKLFNEYHALLVGLGKNYCKKKNPLCNKCPINNYCKSSNSNE